MSMVCYRRCRALVISSVSEEFHLPCGKRAGYEIRGMALCAEHYIEALEHSAHLDFGQWDGGEEKVFIPGVAV